MWLIKCNTQLAYILEDPKIYQKYNEMKDKRNKNKNFERTLKRFLKNPTTDPSLIQKISD